MAQANERITSPENLAWAWKKARWLFQHADGPTEYEARLVRRKKLVRVLRGFYAVPTESRFGPLPPKAGEAMEAIARLKGEQIAPAGAAVANALGGLSLVCDHE